MSFLENSQSSRPIQDLALTLNRPSHIGQLGENTLSLSTLQGRTIVLFVFGTECGTCRYLAGILSGLQNQNMSVAVIGICVQTGCAEKLPEFARSADVRFPLAYCSTRELCPALGIPKSMWLFYPTLIFIDPQQRLRAALNGKNEFFTNAAANLRDVFDELLLETTEVSQAEVAS